MRVIFTQRGEYGGRWYDPGDIVTVPDDFVLPAHIEKIDEATGQPIPTDTGLPKPIPGFFGGSGGA